VSDYEKRIERAKHVLNEAEYLLIGGGAGLSDAAGIKYSGGRFRDNFAPFIAKYGLQDMYSSGFYPFQTQEERWAYWARHIRLNRYDAPATNLYKDLLLLVKGKHYFVLTTNADHQFCKAGFPKEKVFAVQGNYGLLQCTRACHDRLYDNEPQVYEMTDHTADCKIPTRLVPKCPVCGGEMDVNLRKDSYFVQDENWYNAERKYEDFLSSCDNEKVVYLELGVGFNTPGIIRYPFERLTYTNKHATLIRANRDYPQGAKENIERTVAFTEDMARMVRDMQS
jgi:NAD-dependent SIR2 family protein deacetylase